MERPTREQCEAEFPRLLGDPEWELVPVEDSTGKQVGYVAIYRAGGREFATPVFNLKGGG